MILFVRLVCTKLVFVVFFFYNNRCNRRDVESTMFKVEDLTHGDEYEFRVVAYNEAGPSRPSTTAGPIIIQDQSCKTSMINMSKCDVIMLLLIWLIHICFTGPL